MKQRKVIARTAKGTKLGERIYINGHMGLRYKAGKNEEDFTVEELVEFVSGFPVDRIVYKDQACSLTETK